MQIKERIENKLLNRIEISFSWRHEGTPTPSRSEVMKLVKTLEPGSNPDFIPPRRDPAPAWSHIDGRHSDGGAP